MPDVDELPPDGHPVTRKKNSGTYDTPHGTFRSVTTILDAINKPALVPWSARTVAACAIDHLPYLSRVRGRPAREAAFLWLRKAADRQRDDAANLGTAVHRHADARILGTPHPKPTELEAPFVAAFERFLDDYKPSYEATELIVANPADGWAGTCDAWMRFRGLGFVVNIVDYKGLALDTAIPTPTGWTTMRDLAVGDQVFSSDGRPATVTAKSEVHWRSCYRMTFDDTTSVICDDEHLWRTTHNEGRRSTAVSVKTTEEIRSTLRCPISGQRQHRIDLAAPLALPDADLPIDPYVLGCWLGDGKHTSGEISKPDAELFDLISARGHQVGPDYSSEGRCQTRTVYGLRTQLRHAGLLSNKHIPDVYLRASRDQRLDLLRGLMDTDGSWNDVRHQAVFSNCDKALSDAVLELVCSLGLRGRRHEVVAHGFGLAVTAYPVTFTPVAINPFSLSRKADKVALSTHVRAARRGVRSVESIPTVATQCITVDSPDSTYLCTEAMVPTHNTGKGVWPEAALQVGAYSRATHGWTRTGVEVEPPRAERAWVLHLRPDKHPDTGYALVPIDLDDGLYAQFLAAKVLDDGRLARAAAVGEPVTPFPLPGLPDLPDPRERAS